MDVGGSRGLFTTGRCALTLDWGDVGTLAPGTYAQDKTGAVISPGWKQVLDRCCPFTARGRMPRMKSS